MGKDKQYPKTQVPVKVIKHRIRSVVRAIYGFEYEFDSIDVAVNVRQLGDKITAPQVFEILENLDVVEWLGENNDVFAIYKLDKEYRDMEWLEYLDAMQEKMEKVFKELRIKQARQ